MDNRNSISRRVAVKSSVFGLLSVGIPQLLFARNINYCSDNVEQTVPNSRYPAIEESVVAEVVGVSHFDLERLKKLVEPRPELARACWDWGFGDWETAIGAASHVGRKDIVNYLMSKGARPDIFTYAMLGAYSTVKSMIDLTPGAQRIAGPHGISMLQHVKNGLEKEPNNREATNLISYLQSLGDADGETYLSMEDGEKEKYLGDYKYGDGEQQGFSIKLNMRKMISLGKLGKNGGALYKIGDNKFIYNGAPSVVVSFNVEAGKVISLTITEPGLSVIAKKI